MAVPVPIPEHGFTELTLQWKLGKFVPYLFICWFILFVYSLILLNVETLSPESNFLCSRRFLCFCLEAYEIIIPLVCIGSVPYHSSGDEFKVEVYIYSELWVMCYILIWKNAKLQAGDKRLWNDLHYLELSLLHLLCFLIAARLNLIAGDLRGWSADITLGWQKLLNHPLHAF